MLSLMVIRLIITGGYTPMMLVLDSTDLNMTGVTIAESDVMINVTNSVTLNGTIVAGNELA